MWNICRKMIQKMILLIIGIQKMNYYLVMLIVLVTAECQSEITAVV